MYLSTALLDRWPNQLPWRGTSHATRARHRDSFGSHWPRSFHSGHDPFAKLQDHIGYGTAQNWTRKIWFGGSPYPFWQYSILTTIERQWLWEPRTVWGNARNQKIKQIWPPEETQHGIFEWKCPLRTASSETIRNQQLNKVSPKCWNLVMLCKYTISYRKLT